MTARRLVRAGWRVLTLEPGDWVARDPARRGPSASFELTPYYSREYACHGHSGREHAEVGGPSVFYGGASFRLREEDFASGPEIVNASKAASRQVSATRARPVCAPAGAPTAARLTTTLQIHSGGTRCGLTGRGPLDVEAATISRATPFVCRSKSRTAARRRARTAISGGRGRPSDPPHRRSTPSSCERCGRRPISRSREASP